MPGSEVEDTEVVPADDLLLLAGLAPTVEQILPSSQATLSSFSFPDESTEYTNEPRYLWPAPLPARAESLLPSGRYSYRAFIIVPDITLGISSLYSYSLEKNNQFSEIQSRYLVSYLLSVDLRHEQIDKTV